MPYVTPETRFIFYFSIAEPEIPGKWNAAGDPGSKPILIFLDKDEVRKVRRKLFLLFFHKKSIHLPLFIHGSRPLFTAKKAANDHIMWIFACRPRSWRDPEPLFIMDLFDRILTGAGFTFYPFSLFIHTKGEIHHEQGEP
jgi:hypothetical protein